MAIVANILIVLYAVLTGAAGVQQWKEKGIQVRTLLFTMVSIGMLALVFIPDKNWFLGTLIAMFILLQGLAIVQGIVENGRLTYSHHIIRFTFHCIIILLVINY